MDSRIASMDVWMEIKVVVAPKEFKFLQKEARHRSIMVSELIREVVLRYIGNERGSL